MALEEFWNNVRRAARLVRPTVATDSPRLDAGSLARRLASADLWLTRGAVDGYDEADFRFLEPSERTRLTAVVGSFRTLAGEVDPYGPAMREQAERGVSLFRELTDLLAISRFSNADEYRRVKVMERVCRQETWPDELIALRFRPGSPFDDLAVLNIDVTLSKAKLRSQSNFLAQARLLRERLGRIAEDVTPEWFAHISFETDRPNDEFAEDSAEEVVA